MPLAISTLAIVLLALVGLLALLLAGGWAGATRRARSGEAELQATLQRAERELAQAHALDKGWDRATLEAAARSAAEQRFDGSAIEVLQLVQVIDRPGTDADQAVFRVTTAGGEEHRVTLGRSGGEWGPA